MAGVTVIKRPGLGACRFLAAIAVGAVVLGLRAGESAPVVQKREYGRRGAPEKWKTRVPAAAAKPEEAAPRALRPGYGLVTCDLDIDSPGTLKGSLTQQGQYDGEAILIDGRLVAEVPAGSGTARFQFDVAEGAFAWDNLSDGGLGTCVQGIVDTGFTGLYGRLEGQAFPDARVTGCGSDVAIDGEEFFMIVRSARECEVRVVVIGATEIAEGPAVSVRPLPGVDSEVVLAYPPASALRPFPPELLDQRRQFGDFISKRGLTAAPTASPSP